MNNYNIDECKFFDCGNSYATLRTKDFEICKFESKELANEFLREIQKRGEECIQDIAYLYVDRDWLEIYAFNGYFFDEWRIILQRSNDFFGKKFVHINFYL